LLAYNACAACNIEYLGHHLYPFSPLVKSFADAEDKYAPLTLSGIITNKEGSETSMKPNPPLPTVVEYWLPFLIKEGHRKAFKSALGKSVSVNTIIIMPMIKPAKIPLDLVDNVVKSIVLDTELFPIMYRPTIQSSPAFSKIKSNSTKLLTMNSSFGHIKSSNATACQVALANWDYHVNITGPATKYVIIKEALVEDHLDEPTFPPSSM
jgi:hypothetical protein